MKRADILCLLTFIKVQGAQGQTAASELNGSLSLIIVLTLLVCILLLCIPAVTGIIILGIKLNKIWKKLSEKDTIYAEINPHAMSYRPETESAYEESNARYSRSTMSSRISSFRFSGAKAFEGCFDDADGAANWSHNSFPPLCTKCLQKFKLSDCDNLRRYGSIYNGSGGLTQEKSDHLWSGIDLSPEDDNSAYYVDMNACRRMTLNSDLDLEAIYDVPRRYSCTCLKHSSECVSELNKANEVTDHSEVSEQTTNTASREESIRRSIPFVERKQTDADLSNLTRVESKDSGLASRFGSPSLDHADNLNHDMVRSQDQDTVHKQRSTCSNNSTVSQAPKGVGKSKNRSKPANPSLDI
ncbi:uncharacterized protein LOC114654102 [Erpetoichthys calabaricus]|uniref:uncharacterized protein LOC114654102 n=1 Tax=Erpetoichthys calabaricus TaxID=27687 RepID=UPI002234B254|nr:uncharacterized protein LOC114654102 [Erpetoichthys calabaricus]